MGFTYRSADDPAPMPVVRCLEDEMWAHVSLPQEPAKRANMARPRKARDSRPAPSSTRPASPRACICCGVEQARIAGVLCTRRACREFTGWT
jgi:hypothetical protein